MLRSVIGGLLLASVAMSQTTSTAPSSRPAADRSTPLAALRLFAQAVTDGDVQTVRESLHAASDAEARLADAMAQNAAAAASLRRSVERKYGAAAARKLGRPAADRIAGPTDPAKETVDGEKAVVELGSTTRPAPVRLVRIDGEWKIPVTDILGGEDPEHLGKLVPTLRAFARIMEQTAAEVEGDKFRSAEDAGGTMLLRMREAAATQPADQPATASTTAPATRAR